MASYKKVNNPKELMLEISRELFKNIEEIVLIEARDVRDILFLYTKNWYESHEPIMYERTYEFINSLTVSEIINAGNYRYVGIWFDPSKMSLSNNNGWNQHEDRVFLSEIIDEGWYAGDRYIAGSNALQETIKYLEGSGFLSGLKEEFAKINYNIK